MSLSPASGPGGGFAAVGCVLRVQTAMDLHAVADYPLKWDAAYDNEYDFNQLDAVPAGLGITVALNGTSAAIDFAVAGVWAIDICMFGVQDATLEGVLQDENLTQVALAGTATPDGSSALLSRVYSLPAGARITPTFTTTVASTANPYHPSGVSGLITRLA